MDREKQIEEKHELSESIYMSGHGLDWKDSDDIAEQLYNAGYRKQSEGEWIAKTDYAGYGYYCSNCNAVFTGENAEWIAKEHIYCPKCGAKMKGKQQ